MAGIQCVLFQKKKLIMTFYISLIFSLFILSSQPKLFKSAGWPTVFLYLSLHFNLFFPDQKSPGLPNVLPYVGDPRTCLCPYTQVYPATCASTHVLVFTYFPMIRTCSCPLGLAHAQVSPGLAHSTCMCIPRNCSCLQYRDGEL